MEYRDPELAVSVRMPAGWRVGDAFRWGNRETTARLAGPGATHAGNLYFQISPAPASAEEVSKWLLARPEAKAAQRIASGLADYKLRPDSVERRTVGGRPAIRCIADYTQNGTHMVEYLTWVTTENANALFFAMVPVAQLDTLRQRIDPIVESLKIP